MGNELLTCIAWDKESREGISQTLALGPFILIYEYACRTENGSDIAA